MLLALLLLGVFGHQRRHHRARRGFKRLLREFDRVNSAVKRWMEEHVADSENEEEDWGRPKADEFPADAEDQKDIAQEDARDSAESSGQDAEIQHQAYQSEMEGMATMAPTVDPEK